MLSENVRGYVKEKGIVVDHIVGQCTGSKGGGKVDCWYPIVEYKVTEVETKRFRSKVASSFKREVGEPINILVEPNSRLHAVVAGVFGYWAALSIHSILAVAFFSLAAGVTFMPLLNKARKQSWRT